MGSNQYSDLIVGAPAKSERFKRMVYELTEPLNLARKRLEDMVMDFDLDKAVGTQLDAIGARVGISRNLPMKLTDIYFSLDQEKVGLDFGTWKGRYDPEDGLSQLGDELYRRVIKAKILVNHWDGTRESLPEFFSQVLSMFQMDAKILDLEDVRVMQVVLHLTKSSTPPVVWELFSRRLIDVTPAGVGFTIVDNCSWFAFDYDTASVTGFDRGSFFDWSRING